MHDSYLATFLMRALRLIFTRTRIRCRSDAERLCHGSSCFRSTVIRRPATRCLSLSLSLSLSLCVIRLVHGTQLAGRSTCQGGRGGGTAATNQASYAGARSRTCGELAAEELTGAWRYNRPCAQQYVGKSQSCMVTSGRLFRHAPVHSYM